MEDSQRMWISQGDVSSVKRHDATIVALLAWTLSISLAVGLSHYIWIKWTETFPYKRAFIMEDNVPLEHAAKTFWQLWESSLRNTAWLLFNGLLPDCYDEICRYRYTLLESSECFRNHAANVLLLWTLEIYVLPKLVCRPEPVQVPAEIVFGCNLIPGELSVRIALLFKAAV